MLRSGGSIVDGHLTALSPFAVRPTMNRIYAHSLLIAGALLLSVSIASYSQGEQLNAASFGPIEAEETSEYSKIRVRKKGNIRTMMFVRDNGDEVGETRLDITRPERLLTPYTQSMFAAYLFQPKVKRVAVIGVGGGAMLHFIAHHQPDVVVDGVEIDPVVVALAEKYFRLKESETIQVHVADGLKFLAETENKYDVIFMDAFLKPSDDTDDTGAPLALKTTAFYKSLHDQLTEDGVVAINLNANPKSAGDVRLIRAAFPQVYVFNVAGAGNYVVIASPKTKRMTVAQLAAQGRMIDRKMRSEIPFARFVRDLVK